jgi:hypothetical protein
MDVKFEVNALGSGIVVVSVCGEGDEDGRIGKAGQFCFLYKHKCNGKKLEVSSDSVMEEERSNCGNSTNENLHLTQNTG